MILYHVTPYATWTDQIRKVGLVPQRERRGQFAENDAGRIYLFEDEATAIDGLTNWLLDEFPDVRWFALLEIDVPRVWLNDDPEIAGSYFIEHPVPPQGVRLVRKIDGGEPE